MRINAFSDVSLRVLMLLSTKPELLTTRELAELVDTPYNHVSKAVLKLRQMGMVVSVRGRSGGVRISEQGLQATVGGVLRVLDSHPDVAACQTEMGDCPLLHACGLRGALSRAREAFYASLDTVTISSLAIPVHAGPVPVTLHTHRDA
ncbi:Rrf2 family transcriptional regulator [Arthrobacter sp. SDTb3-6]|uniref:RrF2 family transcriptional regulator n=1 Tax=Arthrobacter sp. SDTb3-6 TaxID=2713571 RepID=UPI00159DE6F7|nr:Rrf2 family transcriptional regulator [Arthrobacter sp. SDTb3-6]NVM98923.1 Rrf2 family transcriptional regulator [Arthrobacter sp. SDTb3-6]